MISPKPNRTLISTHQAHRLTLKRTFAMGGFGVGSHQELIALVSGRSPVGFSAAEIVRRHIRSGVSQLFSNHLSRHVIRIATHGSAAANR